MTSRTISTVVLLCAAVVGVPSRFKEINLPTTTSPYSNGTILLGSAPPLCWCGPNTYCSLAEDNTKQCKCKVGYVGSAPSCRPAPELWSLCFADNPCGLHAECEVNNGTRSCPYCIHTYEGSPPHCATPPLCRDIEGACGPNAECDAYLGRHCTCVQGFVGEPPKCTAGPALLAQCDPYPCGPYANCRIQDGRPVCTCEPGYEGSPPRCTPGPEMWRVCFKNRPCGPHAKCEMVDRVAVCSPCDEGYSGQAPTCYHG